jgi:Nif-specific regulatory protein
MSDARELLVERLTKERDLYRALCDLSSAEDLGPLLENALSLAVSLVSAEQGYLEIVERNSKMRARSGLSVGELPGVERQLSSGIVQEALSTGKTIATANAAIDPAFGQFSSVQAGKIAAVLCAPIEHGASRLGVLYLAGRKSPGPFSEEDRALCESFARTIAPTVDRLLDSREREQTQDHTATLRARLAVREIAGKSRALASVFEQMWVAAPVDIAVLIRGESGTGKTQFARALHESSTRKRGPFVEVNASAIPENLFESELFGAEKGAHSTATARVLGKIDAARGGTLFLDEVGDMPDSVQAKLLSFLQSKRYYRLGGTEALTADVRVVAATNKDLEQAIVAKRFREDLYYRLNVLDVTIPALSERASDIPVIAEQVLMNVRGAEEITLTRSALDALAASDWPGNVRQLENAIARGFAVAKSEGARVLEPKHLFRDERKRAVKESAAPVPDELSFRDATRQFQVELIERALVASEWNVTDAARRLDIARSHLNALIKGFGLVRAGRDAKR